MVAAAVGTKPDTMERISQLISAGVNAITIDTAHADSKKLLMYSKKRRNYFQ